MKGIRAQGGKELNRYLKGERLTQRQMILESAMTAWVTMSMEKWIAKMKTALFTL